MREHFRKHGIFYEHSDKAKSALYLDLLPLLNSRAVELLDHQRLVQQLVSLERRTGRSTGRDIIDHPPGMHDDVANAVAGAAVYAASGRGTSSYPEPHRMQSTAISDYDIFNPEESARRRATAQGVQDVWARGNNWSHQQAVADGTDSNSTGWGW